MLKVYLNSSFEQVNNIGKGLSNMRDPVYLYLHSAKQSRNAASLRLPE